MGPFLVFVRRAQALRLGLLCVAAAACNGTNDQQEPDPSAACGLACVRLQDGSPSVTGEREIDGYFEAHLLLRNKLDQLTLEVQAQLQQLAQARDVALTGTPLESAQQLRVALDQTLKASLQAPLILHSSPDCAQNTQLALIFAQRCDRGAFEQDARLGFAGTVANAPHVLCDGSCETPVPGSQDTRRQDAGASAAAQQNACGTGLVCLGTAPGFACPAACTGACELTAAAACAGACEGTCHVASTADCNGVFTADPLGSRGGTCEVRPGAACNGECEGVCQLPVAGECHGACKGVCARPADDAGCEVHERAVCVADVTPAADAAGTDSRTGVLCTGRCNGNLQLTQISDDCAAVALLRTQLSTQCLPGSVQLHYTPADQLQPAELVQLHALLQEVATSQSVLVALQTSLQRLLHTAAALPAVHERVEAHLAAFAKTNEPHRVLAAACAREELNAVVSLQRAQYAQVQSLLAATQTLTRGFND